MLLLLPPPALLLLLLLLDSLPRALAFAHSRGKQACASRPPAPGQPTHDSHANACGTTAAAEGVVRTTPANRHAAGGYIKIWDPLAGKIHSSCCP